MILATGDLDATAARLEAEHGLRAAGGGRHEGIGTHNRVIPLGGGYLEIIAVADRDEAAGSDFGRAILRRIEAAGEGLIGWAVAVEDVAPVAERLGTPITSIAREGMTASLTGVAEAMAEPHLPFFIARGPGIPDPGEGGDAGGIALVELTGVGEELAEWLGPHDLPIVIAPGPGAVVAVALGNGVTLGAS